MSDYKHSRFSPSLWKSPFINATGAEAGRATALLEGAKQPVPFGIRHPYVVALAGALVGAGAGQGIHMLSSDVQQAGKDTDTNLKTMSEQPGPSGVIGKGLQHVVHGDWLGGSLGAIIGATAALSTVQRQMLAVKKKLDKGELNPKYSEERFRNLRQIAYQPEDIALVRGLVSGAYDKAYVDQIKHLQNKDKKEDQGYFMQGVNAIGDMAGKLIPGAGLVLSAPQGVHAVGTANDILSKS